MKSIKFLPLQRLWIGSKSENILIQILDPAWIKFGIKSAIWSMISRWFESIFNSVFWVGDLAMIYLLYSVFYNLFNDGYPLFVFFGLGFPPAAFAAFLI